MSELTPRERELVALGAAMGSNCVPCIEYHIAESRRIGFNDAEIQAAIQHADKIRQVPARKTLQAAQNLLATPSGESTGATTQGCGCESVTGINSAEGANAARPMAPMAEMMSRIMASCGSLAPSTGVPSSSASKASNPAAGSGCGCA